MKQLAELDKIDSGEEENDDKDEDEEFEEVISPQFFWDSKNSTWSPQHWKRRT